MQVTFLACQRPKFGVALHPSIVALERLREHLKQAGIQGAQADLNKELTEVSLVLPPGVTIASLQQLFQSHPVLKGFNVLNQSFRVFDFLTVKVVRQS